jgi:hypothetical protein
MICRINLEQTNYKQMPFKFLSLRDFEACEHIYKLYIDHNNIDNPHPVFQEEWDTNSKYNADVLGYYDQDRLVAWSLIYKFPSKSTVLADQFAWDYRNPKLKLGYKTLRSECAYYKAQGFKFFMLGEDDKYKEELKGFEILTKESHGIFST